MRRAPPTLLAELAVALVELIRCDAPQNQGHRTLKRPMRGREVGVAVLPAVAGLQVRPTQHLAQDPHGGIQARRALRRPLPQILVFLPALLEPHPGRVDPLPQPLALGQVVVGLLLHLGLQAGHLLQQRARQEAALELDRLEADGGSGAGHEAKTEGGVCWWLDGTA